MEKIRAVQAELDPENAKIMSKMGITVKKFAGNQNQTRTTPKARVNKVCMYVHVYVCM
jgi:hypothetical protein